MLGTSQMRSDSSPTPQPAMPACARLALDCSTHLTPVGSAWITNQLCRTCSKIWFFAANRSRRTQPACECSSLKV